jgi:hypothetical protein
MFAPVYDFRALNGIGPRVARDTIGEVYLDPFPEYEDIELMSGSLSSGADLSKGGAPLVEEAGAKTPLN